MNPHPNAEEWMSHLYGEDSPQRHAELAAHLRHCAVCHQQVQTWRGSMAALNTWSIAPRSRRASFAPILRWAAAAVVVVGLGFGLGRATSSRPSPDLAALRASLQKELDVRLASVRVEFARDLRQQQEELAQTLSTLATQAASEEAQQLATQMARIIEAQRTADHRALLAALNQLEEQHLNRYATLREDLDTVAVNADNGLSRAREQLMELATLTQPDK